MKKLVVVFTLALLAAAPASAWRGPQQVKGDLDGDGGTESAYAVKIDIKGVEDMFDQTEVHISDDCAGQAVDAKISGVQDNLSALKLKQADGRAGRDVFFEMRSGAAGRLGEARIVAWRSKSGSPCRVARGLFNYKSDRHTRTPRGGTGDIASFFVSVRDVTKRYRGLEVVLDERFLRRGEPNCCGSLKKVTYWRYSRARDGYVRYRTVLKRVRFRS